MSEFLFLFRGSNRVARSPEEMQKSMRKWVTWFKELNEKGVIKDPVIALRHNQNIVFLQVDRLEVVGSKLSDRIM